MELSVKQQTIYWGIATIVFVLVLWGLGNVLLPFVIGGAIAYCLDPIADRLEAIGCSRAISVAIISLVALLIFSVLILLFIPTLIQQTTALIEAAPEAFRSLQLWLGERFPQLQDSESVIRQQLIKIGEMIQARGAELLNGVLTSALGLLNILVLLIVVPVVTVYLLLDWDNMIAKIDDLLPRDHAPTVRTIAAEIDRTLASFIRGQGTVCIALGLFYIITLTLAGLNFGIVVGFIAGLITFIPYVGAIVGGVLAIGLAVFQYWGYSEVVDGQTITHATDWLRIGIIAGIFAVGQFLEGNIITPKLVGSSIGLHPVWLLLALSVFGSLFGFVGMLVAVPLAAMIGVLARFATGQYRSSRLYRGISE